MTEPEPPPAAADQTQPVTKPPEQANVGELQQLGQTIEQRASNSEFPLVTFKEAKLLSEHFETHVDLEFAERIDAAMEAKTLVRSSEADTRLNVYSLLKETLGISDAEFFAFVMATDEAQGGKLGFPPEDEMSQFATQLVGKLQAEDNPFKTLGNEWKSWKERGLTHRTTFVFRAIAVLEGLYDTILIAKMAKATQDEKRFLRLTRVPNASLANSIGRGYDQADGLSGEFVRLGGDYHRARPLHPQVFDALFKKFILKLPEAPAFQSTGTPPTLTAEDLE